MRGQQIYSLVLVVSVLLHLTEATAASVGGRRDQDLRSVGSQVEMVKYELSNHESEISILKAKIANQEEIIETLKRELDQAVIAMNKSTKGSEKLLVAQEGSMHGVAVDLDKLRAHANSSSKMMEEHQSRLRDLESHAKAQKENISDIKGTLSSILEALKVEAGTPTDGVAIYHVRSGDSLGLIAQKFHTTIKEIKEINHLKSDTIVIGQKLQVPDRLAR